ncbi:hypothetical protein [Vibrio phage BONAISHI]|nr:hypothetical protein [Vibrio phage BONAISHI]
MMDNIMAIILVIAITVTITVTVMRKSDRSKAHLWKRKYGDACVYAAQLSPVEEARFQVHMLGHAHTSLLFNDIETYDFIFEKLDYWTARLNELESKEDAST